MTEFAQPIVHLGSITRQGSLGNLELGTLIHQEIQSRLAVTSADYESEVFYKFADKIDRFSFHISGRADGIFRQDVPIIEEIKTSSAPRMLQESLKDPHHPYALQVSCYAHMHFLKTGAKAKPRLRVVGIRDREETLLEIPYTPEKFQIYFEERLHQLIEQYKDEEKRIKRRKSMVEFLHFPFEQKRLHQDHLIDKVARTVSSKKQILIQAPTGIGKTMAILYPSLKNALSRGSQVIYTAPKNSQFHMVEDAVKKIKEASGKRISSLTLTAKGKLCLNEKVTCDGSFCPYAKDFYTKIHEQKVLDKLKRLSKIDRGSLKKIGEKYEVCPYYLSFQYVPFAEVVILDYNYVFSPQASLWSHLPPAINKEKPTVLVDEAHNLYERALEYYSPKVYQNRLTDLTPSEGYSDGLRQQFEKLGRAIHQLFQQFSNHHKDVIVSLDMDHVSRIHAQFTEALYQYLLEYEGIPEEDTVLRAYFEFSAFASVLAEQIPSVFSCYLPSSSGHCLALVCCNASEQLRPMLKDFHAAIGFSATIKPFEFYRALSGFQDSSESAEFKTPFPDANRKLLIIPQISTNYRHRDHQYSKIADAIERMSKVETGHYFAFFPSYQFLQAVQKCLNPNLNIISQRRGMPFRELDDLCQQLYEPSPPTIFLAVQGSSLSEGLDIRSEFLKGVFVVGPAVPLFSFERNIRHRYYEEKFGSGFNYAYIYPAMAKSIQAAGRVIRSEDKRGLIVLMDHRFTLDNYAESMPSFWFKSSPMECVKTSLLAEISEFWAQ